MGRTACTEPQCLYSRAIPLLPTMGRTACTEPQCLYSTAIPLLPTMRRTACTEPPCLYNGAILLLPPMGHTACTEPQCLYSTAIPLPLLWAVRLVQSLRACIVELYFFSTLWTVRSVKDLSACTVELYIYSHYGPYDLCRASMRVQYSYTSTPPMDRTACTEPQCLYSRTIPLLPV